MAKSFDSHVKNVRAALLLAARIKAQVDAGASKGLAAAASFLTARVKEAMSVPAPRKRVTDRAGNMRYVATTPATAGAPIRKLSSRARTAQTWKMTTPKTAALGNSARGEPTRKHPQGFNCPRYHELKLPGMPGSGTHAFIRPTFEKHKDDVKRIIGGEVRAEFKATA